MQAPQTYEVIQVFIPSFTNDVYFLVLMEATADLKKH